MSNSKPALTLRLLNAIERAGNRLPHPTLLFLWLSLLVLAASWVLSQFGLAAIHPVSGSNIEVVNLLDTDGIYRIFANAVTNFTQFAPVGVVLLIMLGMGVAEYSGLLSTLLILFVRRIPKPFVAYAIGFLGVMSSLGADVGYVVLIPLAGLIYSIYQRPPLAGIAVAFAGVSAGFSANLIIGPVDVMLAGISTEAASIVDASTIVAATDNYYFIAASTFFITVICGWVSNNVVEPRLAAQSLTDPKANRTHSENTGLAGDVTQISEPQQRALRWTGIFTLVFIALIFSFIFLVNKQLATNASALSFSSKDLLKMLVPVLACYFALAGYLYGKVSGMFSSSADAIVSMEKSMATMAYYIVLMFFAAQFVNWFNWSNVGILIAIKGAALLTALDSNSIVLLLGIIFLSATINLFVGSASAKWALLAPVFIPMLMLIDIHPALTQLAYRIGDSTTNIITPLMPYFGIVLAYAQRFHANLGLGHIVSMMIPYSICLLLVWSALLAAWLTIGIPVGF